VEKGKFKDSRIMVGLKQAQSGIPAPQICRALRIELAGGGVDVTMIYPGVVDTHIRRNGLKGDGSRAGVSGLSETGAMSVHECARQMVVAMTKRKRELIMTPKGKFGMLLKAFAPSLVDNMARKALSQEGKKS
jgi:short-subunit dehydrogenase